MNPDGSGIRELQPGWPGPQYQPAVSPDGGKIAYNFNTGSEIRVVNADGTGDHIIDERYPDGQFQAPTWSPDGQHLAYVKGNGIAVDGQMITNDQVGAESGPDWGVDNKIYYNNQAGIFSMDPDGTNKTFVTQGGLPRLSPDSTTLAFTRHIPNEGYALFMLDLATMNEQKLNVGEQVVDFNWSPDGSQLAFSNFNDDVYTVNSDGTNLVNVTNDGFQFGHQDVYPDWGVTPAN